MKQTSGIHLILDTDIGSDVDDAMALLQLLGTSWANNMSVTTVYGDTRLRAQIAMRYCKLAGKSVPIYAGEKTPLSKKDVWVSGLEGSLHDDLENEPVSDLDAVEHMLSESKRQGGELIVLAIGPLTNVAKACLVDPDFPSRVKKLFIMGGNFGELRAEHNFVSDISATEIVLNANFEIVLVGLEATKRISLPNSVMATISESGPAGQKLYEEIIQWSKFWDASWNVPHDPVSVLTLTQPELFTLSQAGKIEIETVGGLAGNSRFQASADGKHQMVIDFDSELVASKIVEDIARVSENRSVF